MSLTYEAGAPGSDRSRRGRGGAPPARGARARVAGVRRALRTASTPGAPPPRARAVRARPPSGSTPGDAIELREAGGELAEAELVAAEVLSLIRSGVPGEEIAVVYRSPARMASLVENVFRRYGIPIAADTRTAFHRTALGRRTARARPLRAPQPTARPGPRTCSSTCARPGCSRTAPTRSTDSRPTCDERACGRWPRPGARLDLDLPEIDQLRDADDPAGRARRARPASAGRPPPPARRRPRPGRGARRPRGRHADPRARRTRRAWRDANAAPT